MAKSNKKSKSIIDLKCSKAIIDELADMSLQSHVKAIILSGWNKPSIYVPIHVGSRGLPPSEIFTNLYSLIEAARPKEALCLTLLSSEELSHFQRNDENDCGRDLSEWESDFKRKSQ